MVRRIGYRQCYANVQRHLRAVRQATRQLRVKRGWSQEELAYRVGMDVSFLSELENGKKEPCLRKIKELAQGLGVSVARLMEGL
jgi:transcriptional regulator with XRE-family HTH domain